MGFSDFSIAGSDSCSDCFFDLESLISARLNKELRYVSNEFNTDGICNVCMIIKEFIKPNIHLFSSDFLETLELEKINDELEKRIKDTIEPEFKDYRKQLISWRKIICSLL